MKYLNVSVAALALCMLAPAASAPQPSVARQRADVLTADAAMEDVGRAQLFRIPRGIQFHAEIDDPALREGDVYTAWWVVFNDWQQCPSGDCGSDPMDFEDPALVGLDIGYATGTIVREDGVLSLAAWLPAGQLEGYPAELGQSTGQGLTAVRNAEIYLIFRDHGPLVPELALDQLTTYMGGCDYSTSPLNPGTAGEQGDFACMDRYYARFPGR